MLFHPTPTQFIIQSCSKRTFGNFQPPLISMTRLDESLNIQFCYVDAEALVRVVWLGLLFIYFLRGYSVHSSMIKLTAANSSNSPVMTFCRATRLKNSKLDCCSLSLSLATCPTEQPSSQTCPKGRPTRTFRSPTLSQPQNHTSACSASHIFQIIQS